MLPVSMETFKPFVSRVKPAIQKIELPKISYTTRAVFMEFSKQRVPHLSVQTLLFQEQIAKNAQEITARNKREISRLFACGALATGVAYAVNRLAVTVLGLLSSSTAPFITVPLGIAGFGILLNAFMPRDAVTYEFTKINNEFNYFKKYFSKENYDALRIGIEKKITALKDKPVQQKVYQTAWKELQNAYGFCQIT